MKVLTDKMLREAGLDFATARALLAPSQDELVIHVCQLLDGQPIPPLEPEPVEPQAVPPLSQRPRQDTPAAVVAHGPAEEETAFRYGPINSGPTDCDSDAPPDLDVSTLPPSRPPRLPEDGRGVTYAQLCDAAAAVRMTARAAVSGYGVVLTDALAGAVAYPDWPSAIRVINARWDYAALGYARQAVEP